MWHKGYDTGAADTNSFSAKLKGCGFADDGSIGLVSIKAAKSHEPRLTGAVIELLYGYIVDTEVYGWLTAGWLTRKSGDPATLGLS